MFKEWTTTMNNAEDNTKQNQLIQQRLCAVDEVAHGQMKEFIVEDKCILLINDRGRFYAIGGKCTHFGVKMINGVYANGRLRCPNHGACFNVATGDIEEYPGLDCLPKFGIKIENDSVILTADRNLLLNDRRIKLMESLQPSNPKAPVIIIGGGPSGLTCVETIRQEGYRGRVLMLTAESILPYNRILLSKSKNVVDEKIILRDAQFFNDHSIDVRLNCSVTSINSTDKCVIVSSTNERIEYSKLVIATGAQPRKLACVGSQLTGIIYLRSPDDNRNICTSVVGKNVAILGSSFIGMEVAALISDCCNRVTVIGNSSTPLSVFGDKVGLAVQKLYESNGVHFIMNSGIHQLIGDDNNQLQQIELNDQTRIDANILIVGIGVTPSTEFLNNSGIEMDARGYIKVNDTMRTNIVDIYAIGDIVCFPLNSFTDNSLVNVQHYQMAQKHGNTAGAAIAGKPQKIKTTPFFWTRFFDKTLRYTGYGVGHDDVIIHGNVDQFDFNINNKLVAVASCGSPIRPVAILFLEIFHLNKTVTKDDVKRNRTDEWNHLTKV